ncbi:hypothetical protein MMJ61_11120 [Enterococcus cecorum]|uniref:hypothetical protein n=1 Tax=Enterococcus cecorum TaxID=44008 RepID=UPI001FAC0119|nr:hypothetical protein [Enterococcus cecorum]MCJ0523182.1 hypothetical protein [Enterococcus cecorum]MCJ0560890.1 hypothetical protein [Enterococcus cecorum]MCJ0572706.1 hypothetical protein [Enterococcus cecorum]MCJ0578839.1 hypothetical protein [Enterococcus cecorum]MCJ0585321.1 hypothetical protein [Enterococcus cecorum]
MFKNYQLPPPPPNTGQPFALQKSLKGWYLYAIFLQASFMPYLAIAPPTAAKAPFPRAIKALITAGAKPPLEIYWNQSNQHILAIVEFFQDLRLENLSMLSGQRFVYHLNLPILQKLHQ